MSSHAGLEAPMRRRHTRRLLWLVLVLALGTSIMGRLASAPAMRAGEVLTPRSLPPFLTGARENKENSDPLPQASFYRVRPADTYWGIARRYGLCLETLIAANPAYEPRRLPIGARLRLPGGSAAPRDVRLRLRWPVGGQITSRYGWRWGRRHKGLDIAAPAGTAIRAAAAGTVTYAGRRAGYGLLVVLSHPGGWRTAYAHGSRLLVSAGQRVAMGDPLARVGATGNATGPHLHFEVSTPSGTVDPLGVLP